MSAKVDQLYGYVQERCLWQFFSRTWDRQENLDGIIGVAVELLQGKKPHLHTPQDRIYYADAKIMVDDFKSRFPWIEEETPTSVHSLMDELKTRLIDISITSSKNRELNHTLY